MFVALLKSQFRFFFFFNIQGQVLRKLNSVTICLLVISKFISRVISNVRKMVRIILKFKVNTKPFSTLVCLTLYVLKNYEQ